jgi:hypothetical protein
MHDEIVIFVFSCSNEIAVFCGTILADLRRLI